jgi:hypothetical protein
VSGEQNLPLRMTGWALVDMSTRPLRWLLDLGRTRRLQRLRRAPVRMIDRSVLLRLKAGSPGGAP